MDPFENPPRALWLTDLGPDHFLVLNKFAVVPEHFILATKDFKPQTHLLEESDLAATLACIRAYEEEKEATKASGAGAGDGGLFAFFNCGEHSGASQPHRHIQLLPLATMREGLGGDARWTVLADQLHRRRPPFATFSEDISLGMEPADLHATYLRLYRRACRGVARHMGEPAAEEQVDEEAVGQQAGEALVSYNMAMTRGSLVIAPRLAEGATICSHEGDVIGNLALNGTVLAGTALVKSELEWDALVRSEEGLQAVLKGIGISSDEIEERDIAP